jgi:predicted nucleotidyltransferase
MGKGADKMARVVELAKIIDADDEDMATAGVHSTEFHRDVAFDNLILLAEVGSNVTGVPRKNDVDQTGVCIEPASVVLAINPMNVPVFEQYEYHSAASDATNQAGDLDVTIFGLRKFVRMAASGAPTALVPLFVPQDAYEASTDAGAALRAQREMFLSKQAGLKFAGMAQGHIQRLHKGQGRKELINKYGYDTDYAYHAMRALMMGIDLMQSHAITLPLPDNALGYLGKVRNGSYTRKNVLKDLRFYSEDLRQSIEVSHFLPESCNYATINTWLAKMYQEHWDSGREY